jgi:hypothetical protein
LVARKSVIVMIRFLVREAPPQRIRELIDQMPGAREVIATDNTEVAGGGLLDVCNDLAAVGVSMFKVHSVASALVTFAREKVGAAAVDEVVAAVVGSESAQPVRRLLGTRRLDNDYRGALRLD